MNTNAKTTFSRQDLTHACGIMKHTLGRVNGVISKLGKPQWPCYRMKNGEPALTGWRPFVWEGLPLEIVLGFALINELDRAGLDEVTDLHLDTPWGPDDKTSDQSVMAAVLCRIMHEYALHQAGVTDPAKTPFLWFLERFLNGASEPCYIYSSFADYAGYKGEQAHPLPQTDSRFAEVFSPLSGQSAIFVPFRVFITPTLACLRKQYPDCRLPEVPRLKATVTAEPLDLSAAERALIGTIRTSRLLAGNEIRLEVVNRQLAGYTYKEKHGKADFRITDERKKPGTVEIASVLDDNGEIRNYTATRRFKF